MPKRLFKLTVRQAWEQALAYYERYHITPNYSYANEQVRALIFQSEGFYC